MDRFGGYLNFLPSTTSGAVPAPVQANLPSVGAQPVQKTTPGSLAFLATKVAPYPATVKESFF